MRSPSLRLPIDLILRSPYRAVAPAPSATEVARFLDEPEDYAPVFVRRLSGDRYELLAGEFVWRLAQAAGLHTLLVRVLDGIDNEDAAVLARMDATSETAKLLEGGVGACAQKLLLAARIKAELSDTGDTQEEVGRRYGLSQGEVSYHLRVLRLPEEVLRLGRSGELSFSQLRRLSRLPPGRAADALELAHQVVNASRGTRYRRASSVTVEELDRRVSVALGDGGQAAVGPQTAGSRRKDPDIERQERALTDRCGHEVEIDFDPQTASGWVRVRYNSLDEFDLVSDLIAPSQGFDD